MISTRTFLIILAIATIGCGGNASSTAAKPPTAPESLVLVERFYDNGRPSERGYVGTDSGERFGAWKFWFDDGQLRWKGSYTGDAVDNKLPWREYNRDGSVRMDWQDQ
jgi:hypothetical protein